MHAFHLSTNYRNSAEIYDFAAAYAERVGLDADLPNAVRSTGIDPGRGGRRRPRGRRGARSLVELLGSVAGTVGIVVPVARRAEVRRLALASWPELAARSAAATTRVVVLTGLDTKGLEFDGIVVVDARSEIEAESPAGRATLYVVYTRATQRMVTVSQS